MDGEAIKISPRTPEDAEALRALAAEGEDVYVFEALPFDMVLILRRQHLRELHAAPWWRPARPPQWLED